MSEGKPQSEAAIEVDGHLVRFGDPNQWRDFAKRNKRFMDTLPAIKAVMSEAFDREVTPSCAADSIIHALGRIFGEEFSEVLLLAGNGHGTGAIRGTRVMFERFVTARYLSKNPDQADKFLDYYWIAKKKMVRAWPQPVDDVMSASEQAFLEENYQRVRPNYMVTLCKECETTRLNHTWHELDLVSMAKQVEIEPFPIFMGYLVPTQQDHATMYSILARLKRGTPLDEKMSFRGFTPDHADDAVAGAHALLLYMLKAYADHFHLDEIHQQADELTVGYSGIWSRQPTASDRLEDE